MKKYILTLFVALSISHLSFSQENTESVYNEDIIVRTIFDPVVNEAYKINDKPQTYETKFEIPPFQYEKTTKQFPTTMVFEQIKPAKVKGEPLSKLYNSHIKAGVGTYFTSLLDLSLTGTEGLSRAILVCSLGTHHLQKKPHHSRETGPENCKAGDI